MNSGPTSPDISTDHRPLVLLAVGLVLCLLDLGLHHYFSSANISSSCPAEDRKNKITYLWVIDTPFTEGLYRFQGPLTEGDLFGYFLPGCNNGTDAGHKVQAIDFHSRVESLQTISFAGHEIREVPEINPRMAPFFFKAVPLNRADAATLATMPGIGIKLAERIVRYRQQHGPFGEIDDLQEVNGIGVKKIAGLRPRITLD